MTEVEQLQYAVKSVMDGVAIPEADRDQFIHLLERYECWTPFFKVIEQKKDRCLEDYVRLAKVQNIYLEDIKSAAKTCVDLVQKFHVNYVKFQMEIIPQIIEQDDFIAEAYFLDSVADSFKGRTDIVTCLEHLAMLYEKKVYSDTQLAHVFENLIKFDPGNLKALRYFKLVYTQEQDWQNVARLLGDILKNVKHKQEKFRVAQELAAVSLYHLDKPKDALQQLDKYCSDSPLDTTKIKYDAYTRLGDWSSCLKVLERSLQFEKETNNKAVLHFKIAELHMKLHSESKAKQNYETACVLWPEFLEPLEKVIDIYLKQTQWQSVIEKLEDLKAKIHDEHLKKNITEAQNRISSALQVTPA